MEVPALFLSTQPGRSFGARTPLAPRPMDAKKEPGWHLKCQPGSFLDHVPPNGQHFGIPDIYRLENWGARRAAFRPY